MDQKEINKLKVESSIEILKVYASHVVTITKEILYKQQVLDTLLKKKKRSEDEEKKIKECESDIKHAKADLEENEAKLEVMRTLIETYSNNQSVKL